MNEERIEKLLHNINKKTKILYLFLICILSVFTVLIISFFVTINNISWWDLQFNKEKFEDILYEKISDKIVSYIEPLIKEGIERDFEKSSSMNIDKDKLSKEIYNVVLNETINTIRPIIRDNINKQVGGMETWIDQDAIEKEIIKTIVHVVKEETTTFIRNSIPSSIGDWIRGIFR